MNWNAYAERKNNERYIQGHYRQGCLVFEIDRRNVRFRGRRWTDLADYDKRKFENGLFLEHSNERRPIRFIYV